MPLGLTQFERVGAHSGFERGAELLEPRQVLLLCLFSRGPCLGRECPPTGRHGVTASLQRCDPLRRLRVTRGQGIASAGDQIAPASVELGPTRADRRSIRRLGRHERLELGDEHLQLLDLIDAGCPLLAPPLARGDSRLEPAAHGLDIRATGDRFVDRIERRPFIANRHVGRQVVSRETLDALA